MKCAICEREFECDVCGINHDELTNMVKEMAEKMGLQTRQVNPICAECYGNLSSKMMNKLAKLSYESKRQRGAGENLN